MSGRLRVVEPISPADEALVRREGGFGDWPIPGLLAEIDRLRLARGTPPDVQRFAPDFSGKMLPAQDGRWVAYSAALAAQPSAELGLREAAAWVLRAHDAYVEAVNGNGHAGTEHDRMIHFGPARADEVEIFDMVGDCAACGGAQYGTEDDLSHAFVALRLALGQPFKPWETHYAAALASKARS